MMRKAVRIRQRLERGREPEVAVLTRVVSRGQEQPAEETRQHTDRQEEPRATGDPPAAIRREPSAGDDAMEMRVVHERLAPQIGRAHV